MNFVNRRFIATWYDTAPPDRNAGDAWAYDADAVRVLGRLERNKGRRRASGGTQDLDGKVRADSYPAALFIAPDGTRVGDGLWGVLSPEAMLTALRQLVADHPELFPRSDEEQRILARAAGAPASAAAQLDAARLHWELADFDACVRATDAGLAAAGRDRGLRSELLYLKGRALACRHRADQAEVVLAEAASLDPPLPAMRDAITVARARARSAGGDHEGAIALLGDILSRDAPTEWTGAALYETGLALHRLGRGDEAKDVWRRHRRDMPFDRLARRSAASLGLPEAEAFLNQELVDESGWW
jgi:tetratricopeptide (TPR) repeat protein